MTTEIKLPPLPELGEYATSWERIIEWHNEPEAGTKALALSDKVDDEITATLQAYATAAVEQDRAQRGEPIAWMWQHDETGRTGFIEANLAKDWVKLNPRLPLVCPVYAAPQPERKPMTKGQREQVARRAEAAMNGNVNLSWRDALMSETEAFHGIKETP